MSHTREWSVSGGYKIARLRFTEAGKRVNDWRVHDRDGAIIDAWRGPGPYSDAGTQDKIRRAISRHEGESEPYDIRLQRAANSESREIVSELHGVYEFVDTVTGKQGWGWYCDNCEQVSSSTWLGGHGWSGDAYDSAGNARTGLFTHRRDCPAVITITEGEQRQIGAILSRALASKQGYSAPLKVYSAEIDVLRRIAERNPAMLRPKEAN